MSEDETINLKDACKETQEKLDYCHRFLMHIYKNVDVDILVEEAREALDFLHDLNVKIHRIQQALNVK